jgi:septal ring factor EnvC (AmiA/AmiB activator)
MLIMQLAVEAVLVALLLLIWRRTRLARPQDPTRMPENLKNSIENFLAESEKIAGVFAENLKDKKDLSADLILKLDRRLSDYQVLLRQTEASFNAAQKKLAALKNSPAALASVAAPGATAGPAKANPAAPEVRALVLQMAKKGHSPEEIAAKARLHLGEVELIIDLERQFNL